MNRRTWLTSVACGVATLARPAAQPRYIDGVFVHGGKEPIELLAFAERSSTGQLRLAAATFEDVPAVTHVYRVLCSLPNWKPVMVWVSSRAIFRNEYAERRQLRFGGRQLNVYAAELRIAEVEQPERAARLVRSVGGTKDNPAYLFVTLDNGSVSREYMVELAPES